MLVRRVPPIPSPVLLDVFDRLEARGFEIESGIAEETVIRPDRLTVRHDLYVLKSHTELTLSLAGVLHAQGARFLGPYPSCLATQDKIMTAHRLHAAGVPIPRCWVTGDLTLLSAVAEERSLIIKPHRGHRGAGIAIVNKPQDLESLPASNEPVLIQEYVRGSGEDIKVYVVGDDVFAVRKPFSETSFTRPGRPCEVDPEVRRIALRCGMAAGLGLYGLDVIDGPDGPVVVDLNYFPGYKGVPDIAPLIADYIEGYALAERGPEPLPIGLDDDGRERVDTGRSLQRVEDG